MLKDKIAAYHVRAAMPAELTVRQQLTALQDSNTALQAMFERDHAYFRAKHLQQVKRSRLAALGLV